MSIILIDSTGLIVSLFLFMGMGIAAVIVMEFASARQGAFIAKVMEQVGGTYSMVKKVRLGITQESFNVGDLQFVKDESKVSCREPWNRWGGSKPVLVYDIRDAKPMENDTEGKPAQPKSVKYTRDPKPSSASVNLIFRRGGLKAMMAATKSTAANPILIAVMVGIAMFALAFMIGQFYHPGLVSAPPSGYYYKVLPVPQNVTIS